VARAAALLIFETNVLRCDFVWDDFARRRCAAVLMFAR
jgi:hypothetical protein